MSREAPSLSGKVSDWKFVNMTPRDNISDDEGPSDDEIEAFDDEDDADVVECPHCGREVYDDADRCPHCGMNVVRNRFPRWPIWFIITVIIVILIVLGWTGLFGLF